MRKILLIVLLAGFAVLPLAAEGGEIEANDLGFSFSAGAPLFGEAGLSPDGALVTGYGVGLVYHPLTFLSVEPSFLFYKTDKEKDVSTGTDNGEKREQTLLGFCLGVFYYGDLGAGLYYYAGPRVTYYKNEYERTYEQNNNDSFSETQQMIYSLAAGLKYMLSDRFSFFADAGFGYINETYKSKSVDQTGSITSEYEEKTDYYAFTKASLGVTFYIW